jgi:hypothetical protein
MDQTASLPPYLIGAIGMADPLAKAKRPLLFETQLSSLKTSDFGNGTLALTLPTAGSYTASVTWISQHIGREKPDISHSAVQVRSPGIVFPMIAGREGS